jgi:hypothetical protein
MANEQLKSIFLSASIPTKDRHLKYHKTADVIAIRDSVIALASTLLPNYRLVWGGHPSITPMIYYVMEQLKMNIQEHVTLYQSKFFEHLFPEDNNKFQNVILTENTKEINSSLLLMRKRMFSESDFSAAIFIGGMDGIEVEYKLFKEYHPKSIVLPIASTGGASKKLYEEVLPIKNRDSRLENDYGYMSLFQDLIINKI